MIIIIIVNTDVTGNHGLNVYKMCNNATNIKKTEHQTNNLQL